MGGWSVRQYCSGGCWRGHGDCCNVLGMPESLGYKKGVIAAEENREKQASVHWHCRGSRAVPKAFPGPTAHRCSDPQGSASPHAL